ncbi:phage regulatory CII family protein [Sphingomonas faeni]|uniref:phage regulatory CII family protein n=1 Tax=Sphingomonas faeni TaxID=185950 RepID=UPI0033555065
MTPEKLNLKRATGEMLKGVGGLEAASGFCRVGKSALGDNQSVNKPESFVALDVIADLEPLARDRDGWPHVTRALAATMGFVLVKLPEVPATSAELLSLIGRHAKEGGDVSQAVCRALADNHVSRSDAREIRREIREQMEVLAAMDAAMAFLETD